MKHIKLLYLIVAIFLSIEPFAQVCGTVEYMDALNKQYKGLKDAHDAQYTDLVNKTKVLHKTDIIDTLYRIPVVFHILYNNTRENVPDSLVHRALNILNDAFRHRHKDTGRIRRNFKNRAVDSKIEFYFAKTKPNGDSFNGINRVSTSRSNFYPDFFDVTENDPIKNTFDGGQDAYDPKQYMNIWICNLSSSPGQIGVLGYALPPLGNNNWGGAPYDYYPQNLEGVVLHFETLLRDITASRLLEGTGFEKSIIHEAGHYLGLRHIWGDGPCFIDDLIDDTPLAREANFYCSYASNSCNSGSFDEPDMIENYMDYSSEECLYMFTKQQVLLAREYLTTLRPTIGQRTPTLDSVEVAREKQEEDLLLLYNLQSSKDQIIFPISWRNHSVDIYLYNQVGQLLRQENLSVTSENLYRFELNQDEFSPGIYYVKIHNKNINKTETLKWLAR